jgi:hypothetical protein
MVSSWVFERMMMMNATPILFDEVILIPQTSDEIFFIVDKFQSVFHVDIQLHYMIAKQNTSLVGLNGLADYYPLHEYRIGQRFYIHFHHSVYYISE